MSNPINIVLVDDHPLLREGVAYTLEKEPDIVVLGQGANDVDAERLTRDLSPQIVILDIGIPGGGIQAAASLSSTYPETRIIMLTASADEDDLVAALRAGAQAYVLKGVSARELIRIVRLVADGERYITPNLAASVLTDLAGGKPLSYVRSPLNDLTAREREVLDLVALGMSNKEIGETLFLSEKTVKHYMTIVFQKLQVRNRVEAALIVQAEP